MEVTKMLADLRQQRMNIDTAIRAMEALAIGGTGKRRGRPPAWMSAMRRQTPVADISEAAPTKQRKANGNATKTGRTFSRAQKKAASVRMKKMWAKRKKPTTAAKA